MQEYREQELQFHAMNPGLRIALGLPDRTCEQICQEWLDRGGQPAILCGPWQTSNRPRS